MPNTPTLSVRVQGRPVAVLLRERDNYVLQYRPDTAEADFVSLTMPVQATAWSWPRDLHPFFRQNLPEGYLLSILREEFGPALDGTDLGLLGLVGARSIGRVNVVPKDTPVALPADQLDLSSLLHADFNVAYFDQLVRKYVRSAVSGVVPKFLAEGSAQPPLGRATLRTGRYIVKGSSQHPYMAFNEHYTLRVIARLGKVPVAHTQLSDDGQTLLVERFDVDAHGNSTHGLEDACSLLGLAPHEKYAPSMERVIKATAVYLPDATRQKQLVQLGYHVLVNFVVRNADCHAKNIALYYTGLDDVAYTPIYDLVTTAAYDGMRDRNPGLTIAGRQSWEPGRALPKFFAQYLGINTRDYLRMCEELCEAAASTAHELVTLAAGNPAWAGTVRAMLWAWDQGICTMRPPTATVSLAPLIKRSGLESADLPAPAPRTGESPLLGKRRSAPRVRRARTP